MPKFTKLYSEFAEAGLNPTEQVAMSLIYDRMNLSKENNDYYDDKYNAYFVTFSREALAAKMNVSLNTVTNVFRSLKRKGWLVIKQRFNSSNRIFLPNELEHNICEGDSQNLHSNYTSSNQTDKNRYEENDTKKTVAALELDGLTNSIIVKSGFSNKVASSLKALSFNDPDKLYYYVKLILKSKRTALRFSVPKNSELRRFETNPLLNAKLEKSLEPIIRNANRKAKNSYGYMLSSFRNLFEEAIDEYSQKTNNNSNDITEFLPGNLAF